MKIHPKTKFILLLIFIFIPFSVSALDTGWQSPETMVDDDTVGTKIWINVDNAKVSDNAYATAIELGPNFETLIEYSIRIVKDGVILGDNKSTGAGISGVDTYFSYGGAEDLWGLGWTSANINASDFGVVFSVRIGGGVITHYLKATNFSFSVPVEATINGIEVEVEQKERVDGPSIVADVDHSRIKVYYTEEEPPPELFVLIENATTGAEFFLRPTISYGKIIIILLLLLLLIFEIIKFPIEIIIPQKLNFRK